MVFHLLRNYRMAEALKGLTGYWRIANDIVIYDKDSTQNMRFPVGLVNQLS